MNPGRTLCVLVALAVITIAGAFASAPAMAHAGHSHAVPIAAERASASDDVALALLELASPADLSRDAAPAAAPEGGGQAGATPCEGHCCTISGSHCCGFAPPLALHTATSPIAIDARGPPASDHVRNGRNPNSLLRPPKSFA